LELAKLLRAMEIDIAIDLSGHTEGTRLDVLSHRPAPVQMTYLGFPGTLGLSFIDYLIADPVTIPPELQKHYAEKILYLPHCYLPRDTSVVPSPITPKRSDFGLPEEGFVFCSFNHDYKINPFIFKLWMELLRTTINSVLWLMKLNKVSEKNILLHAQAYGIDKNRIIFASRVPSVEEHLARYRLADIFIDTFPYNGHTTTSDALLAGLPVISLSGTSFASCVASSLLNDVKLPELICNNYQDYFLKAVKLSKNKKLKEIYSNQLINLNKSNFWPKNAKIQAHEFQLILLKL